MQYKAKRHRTFVVNLEARKDRRQHITAEFLDRPEFDLKIIPAISHQVGAIGFWQTVIHILDNLTEENDDYIILCEDDHQFTADYEAARLHQSISNASACGADLLLGGVSGVHSPFITNDSLVWVEKYTGNQFVIIYRKIFKDIINMAFNVGDDLDLKLSKLSANKFLLYPFISVQKEFGYSDVTALNNEAGRVTQLFRNTAHAVDYISSTQRFFGYHGLRKEEYRHVQDISISTYLFNHNVVGQDTDIIRQQFAGRAEFDLLTEFRWMNTNQPTWQDFIRNVAIRSNENEESIIIICDDRHRFTTSYSAENFIKDVVNLYQRGVDLISGGVDEDFVHVLPIGSSAFWINEISDFSFVVIADRLFNNILETPIQESDRLPAFLSRLTSNKAILYPFISQPEHRANADYIPAPKSFTSKGLQARLGSIKTAFEKFGCPELNVL